MLGPHWRNPVGIGIATRDRKICFGLHAGTNTRRVLQPRVWLLFGLLARRRWFRKSRPLAKCNQEPYRSVALPCVPAVGMFSSWHEEVDLHHELLPRVNFVQDERRRYFPRAVCLYHTTYLFSTGPAPSPFAVRQMFMFGGYGGSGRLDDFWEFDFGEATVGSCGSRYRLSWRRSNHWFHQGEKRLFVFSIWRVSGA